MAQTPMLTEITNRQTFKVFGEMVESLFKGNLMNNEVELIGYYGGDKSHALSAWTSTSRELNEDKEKRIGRLLTMLAEAGHHTPFEKSSIHFLVTTDIASHIQILKHRVGVSVNAESARYKELKEDKYYLPEDWPQKYLNNQIARVIYVYL